MTDPERISHRASGLAAELLRAGATEQPRAAGIERTLAALGVSGALLTTASAASAGAFGTAVGSAGAAGAAGAGAAATAASGAKAVKAVSSLLLAKWIGVGVVGGVGLAGAAAVVTEPPASAPSVATVGSARPAVLAPAVATPAHAAPEVMAPPEPEVILPVTPSAPVANAAVAPAQPEVDVGAPLAAEVALIDRARAALAAGRAEQGLSLLAGYEREFPEARLLPEVLFLRLETCQRLGRQAEARAAAARLVEGFPKSPHAARARQLLGH